MERYSAAQARQHLAAVLDAAEAGLPVVIERAGVRFRVRAEARRRRGRRARLVEWLDPAVEGGNWTWVSTKRGLRFSPRKPRRR
jgi:antitoxin (DNA-binding transcriptional repressor) of toxin-antitoxin stability system